MRRQAAQLKFAAKRTSLTGEKEMMSMNLLGFAAQSIAVHASNPPLRLLVGKAAVGIIDHYLNARRSEYEAWREVSAGTDFD